MASEVQPTPSGFSDATVIDPIEPSFPLPDTPIELPHVIPPAHRARTLVLCFDGTGDQFDSDNSNIVEFFSMLKKDDRSKQMVYYQAGIGTYTSPQVATPMAAKFSKALDEAVAWNLSAHVMDGYEFLMQNYEAGDRICIFGFSRGAYTARGLAGMIHKVGLLPACNHQQVPFAYKMFKRTDELGWLQSNQFKKAFSVDVDIEFIGVWDTVNSVGLIPRRLPFTTSNNIVRTFRHAVALDERRAKFKANHWNVPTAKEASFGLKPEAKPAQTSSPTEENFPQEIGLGSPKNSKKAGKGILNGSLSALPGEAKHDKRIKQKAFERHYSQQGGRPTDVEEVWFAGCHCDVGGGSVENDTPNSLARIPLRWMVRECFKTETGIMFETETLRGIGLDPASLYPYVKERPPRIPGTEATIQRIPKSPPKISHADADDLVKIYKTEEEEELLDALSPIYDQLSLKWWNWWILELVPFHQRWQRSDTTWETSYMWNLGHGRFIPKQKKRTKVHRSVLTRIEARHGDKTEYVPKASFEKAKTLGTLEWVD